MFGHEHQLMFIKCCSELTSYRVNILTYVFAVMDGLSQELQTVLKSYRLATFFRPHTTLRKLLVAPKEPVPIDKRSGCVYELSCQYCTATYIGQTGRHVGQRIKEHKSSAPNRIPSVEHSTEAHHTIDWDIVKILDREDREFPRQVKEAIQI